MSGRKVQKESPTGSRKPSHTSFDHFFDAAEDVDIGAISANQFPFLPFLAASGSDEMPMRFSDTDSDHPPSDHDNTLSRYLSRDSGARSHLGAPRRRQSMAESVRSSLSNHTRDALSHADDNFDSVDISSRIANRLGISQDEKILGKYPAWLLKDVLVQGEAFLTAEHLYFHANLPISSSAVIKAASLRKRSFTGMGWSRYWFVLRQDSFCYFTNSADVYFPAGTISLSDAKYCSLEFSSSGEPTNTLHVVTEAKTYTLKADNANSAHEWAKAIEKEIFRSRNKGDYVRVKLPLRNVVAILQSEVLDMAQLVRFRYIDGPEAVHHHPLDAKRLYMAFFTNGKEIVKKISDTWDALDLKHHAVWTSDHELADGSTIDPSITEHVTDNSLVSSMDFNLPKHVANSLVHASSKNQQTQGDYGDDENHQPLSPQPSHPSHPNHSGNHRDDYEHSKSKDSHFSYPGAKSLHALTSAASSVLHFGHHSGTSTPRGRNGKCSSNAQSTAPSVAPTRAASPVGSGTLSPSESYTHTRHDHGDLHEAASGADTLVPTETDASKDSKHKSRLSWLRGSSDEQQHAPEADRPESSERFRDLFAFGDRVTLVETYTGYLRRGGMHLWGKLYLSNEFLAFRRLAIGSSLRMILPLDDIDSVDTASKSCGLIFGLRGHENILIEFSSDPSRDEAKAAIVNQMELRKQRQRDHTEHGKLPTDKEFFEYNLRLARLCTYEQSLNEAVGARLPPLVIDPTSRESNEKFLTGPAEPMRVTMLTIGSRGDVQPYIALSQGLMAEGHHCKIATHAEFKDWIEGYGIEFAEVAGDPKALMEIMIEHGSFSVGFLIDAASKFRSWLDELLQTAWTACQDSDLLIESPSAMAGLHIAEALKIPYFRAFTMPWTRTRTYPQAFIVPEQNLGGSYNYMTYVMFEKMLWGGISSQVNRWREDKLHIKPTSLERMHQSQVPFLYCVSPHILVPPVDQPDWIHVTGYWDLEPDKKYKPDPGLVEFIERARSDNKKLVYIGFGSIVVQDAKKMTKTVVESVEKAGVRCILAKGWSDRSQKDKDYQEEKMPDSIYQIDQAPHQWLFPKVDAAVHHGGSGTTGASLGHGLPTIIKPFFGDQFFYGTRVENLGVGFCIRKLTVSALAKALVDATTDEKIISRAKNLGDQIAHEHGVLTGIHCIYRELSYARSIVKENEQEASPTESENNTSRLWDHFHNPFTVVEHAL